MACGAVANIVKTSLGPVGLDKVRIVLFNLFARLLVFQPPAMRNDMYLLGSYRPLYDPRTRVTFLLFQGLGSV
jgi:hypothetical protein